LQQCEQRLFLEQIILNVNKGHCWILVLQTDLGYEDGCHLGCSIIQSTQRYNPEDKHLHSHHRKNFKSYLTLDTTVTIDFIVAYAIPLVALLTCCVMWHKEWLWS
jgi:hypothetical protein